MKKTLVALAALASVSAFAQSSVQITGNFDAGYQDINNQDGTKSAKYIKNNGASTSAIFFKGEEDLGGGLKAVFLGELDINPVQSSTANGATGAQYFSGTPFNGEQYVGLAGNFGGVKVGTPNSAILEANGEAQPFGTALGGGYSSSGLGRNGVTSLYGVNQFVGAESEGNRVIRHERTVRYDTPVFSGFSASYEWSGGNANRTAADKQSSNTNEWTSLGAKYSNGPLKVAYATGKAASVGTGLAAGLFAGGTATTDMVPVNSALTANTSVKHTFAAANYTVGNVTVYGGMTSTKTSGITISDTAGEDMTSSNLAVKYVMGNIDLMANVVSVKDKAARTTAAKTFDGKLTGLGANYNFSKRTLAYVRYEKFDNLSNDAAKGEKTTTAIGIRHQF